MAVFVLLFFASLNGLRQEFGLHLVVRLRLIVECHFMAMMLARWLAISKLCTRLMAWRCLSVAEIICLTWRTSTRGENINLLRLRVLLDELIIRKIVLNMIIFLSLFALRGLRLESHHCLGIFVLQSCIWRWVDLWRRLHVVSQVLYLLKVFLAPHGFARLLNLSDALD